MALLGFGSPYDDKMTSLLGIDPSAARQQALWNGIAQMGAALMGTRNMGLVGGAFLNGINKGKEDYLANAYDAYRIKTAADDKAYQRGLDKQQQSNWEKGFGLQQKSAARADEQLRMQMEEQQRLIDQHNAQQDYVTGWMGNADQKGANLLPQGIRTMARQHGVEGVLSPTDEWRYNNAAPFVGAQDYGNAFNQIAAQPGPQKAPTVQTFYEDGMEVKKQWNENTGSWETVGGSKAPSGGITVDKDGNVTIGGPGGKMNADDKRANALATQIVSQEPTLMSGFETLADPKNYAGSKIPGGSLIMSPDAQVAQDAITNTVANWLYLTSGATATDAEIERQTAMVTPTPMDSPQRVAAKKARLKSIFDTMRARGGVPAAQEQPQAETQQSQPDPANPQPGDVVLGYRFKGGNRRDPNNWEKVQ